jgi:hypothetical protein
MYVMVNEEDVKKVAESINMEVSEEQIEYVMRHMDSACADEPYSTWDLIAERLLWEADGY